MPIYHPKPIPVFSPLLVSAFWSLVPVDMHDSDACWLWRGLVSKSDGYGRWKNFYAHRVAYTLTRGQIPEGLTIDHTCRHRLCMNPAHMETVTPSENVRRKGERGPSIGPPVPPRKRTAARFHRRRERGVCVQCNTPSVKFRCDRCREIHNARNKGRKR